MKLAIKNASVSFGAKEILRSIDFEVNERDKIAIIGRNGSGKTTLLKLINGTITPDKAASGENEYSISTTGKVSIGYLEQIAFEDESITLEEEVLKIFSHVLRIKEKLKTLEQIMAENPTEQIVNQYVAAEHDFEINGGYTLEKEYNIAFSKFGFEEADKKKPICEFSGGQKTRIALIKLLFLKPDILILDEPTNHLDLAAITWLEEYLRSYQKALIVVSHDREFVDRVANVVYEIENKTTHRYVGNYSKFVETKKIQRAKQQKEYTSYVEEVTRLQQLADKFRYKATKATMAQSKLKQIERMEVVDAPERVDDRNFHFELKPRIESALEVIKLDKLKYGYTSAFGELSAKVYKGDRVAVVGGNGLGKSTLLKTIMQKIPLLGGKIKFGQSVEIGYFDQQTITLQPVDETIIENFMSEFPETNTLEARKHLGAFLFTKDDVFKKINDLSGGERVRLELSKIFKRQPNLLILDEPTNHMDISGREALEEILLKYEGTILFVSHDRYFVKKLATGIIELTGEDSRYFCNTTYEQYEKKRVQFTNENKVEAKIKDVKEHAPNEYVRNKNMLKKRQKLERDIEKLENEIDILKKEYFAPENCSDAELLCSLQLQIEQKENSLNMLMSEWLEIS